MFKKSIVLCLSVVMMSAAFLVGCTDRKEIKQDLTAALKRQAETKSFHFKGNADLKIRDSFGASGPSLTTALIAFLKDSKLTWEGYEQSEPARLEADLTIKPHAMSQTFNVPLLLKDNAFYASVPLLNKKDEFLQIKLSEEQQARLQNVSGTFAKLTLQLANKLDVKSFDRNKQDEIVVELNENNARTLLSGILGQIEQSNETAQAGAKSDSSSKKTASYADKIQVKNPGSLTFKLDGKGNIKKTALKLEYTLKGGNSEKTSSISLELDTDGWNEQQPFKKDTPSKVLPYDIVQSLLQTK